MEIRKQILTKNNCYKAGVPMTPKGVLWHSTGANNPKLSRYVPDDGNLGPNKYNNHWDQPRPGNRDVCVHAFIGKDKNGEVQIYQTLPFDMRCWGAGKGKKGSANDSYIQFEICEDKLDDKEYFNQVYKAGVWFTAEMVKRYNIDVNSISIIDHSGAYKLGIASNHGDVMKWFKIYNKTMNDVIEDVKKLLNGTPAPEQKPQEKPQPSQPTQPATKEFTVKITVDALNVRQSPSPNAAVNTVIRDRGLYTIVDVDGKWGKLKSGAGWIHLDYTDNKVNSPTTPPKKSDTQIAAEVKLGLWGNGAARIENLKKAGYDPSVIQAIVNQSSKPTLKSNTQIAKEVLLGKWGNGAARKLSL